MDIETIHGFLNSYGFRVERLEIELALFKLAVKYERRGSFFKALLLKMSRPVDWMVAEMLEEEFERRYPDIDLYGKP